MVYSQPVSRDPSQVTVEALLKKTMPELYGPHLHYPFCAPKLVHRLDYQTSGAMVLATSQTSARMLSRGLKSPQSNSGYALRKYYLGLVSAPLGQITTKCRNNQEEGMWTSPVTLDGSPASTRYFVIGSHAPHLTLLLFELITGKKHQIRKHCIDNLSAPLAGDFKYTCTSTTNKYTPGPIALHSYNVKIRTNPNTDWVSVTAPLSWEWGPLSAENQARVDSIIC